MALDFEKVKTASLFELAVLFVCEFSRGVDALERIAPDAEGGSNAPSAAPTCPHPEESRVNASTMGQEPFASFRCGLCGDTVHQQPVEA